MKTKKKQTEKENTCRLVKYCDFSSFRFYSIYTCLEGTLKINDFFISFIIHTKCQIDFLAVKDHNIVFLIK